jgi:mRNA-degrading endonuclease RelE of RelBE toxin-antitoxin system
MKESSLKLSNNAAKYTILIENRALDGWRQLEEACPDEMEELKQYLQQNPTNTRITNGKCKRLKGKLKEYYQYDVSYNDRVRYQVDQKSLEVRVVFANGHP